MTQYIVSARENNTTLVANSPGVHAIVVEAKQHPNNFKKLKSKYKPVFDLELLSKYVKKLNKTALGK